MFRRKNKNKQAKQPSDIQEDPSDTTPDPAVGGGFGVFRRGKRSNKNTTVQQRQQRHQHRQEHSDSDYSDSEEPESLHSGGPPYGQNYRARGGPTRGGAADDISAASSLTSYTRTSHGGESKASKASRGSTMKTEATSKLNSGMSAEEQFMAYYQQRKQATSEVPTPTDPSISPTPSKSPGEIEEDRKARARQAVEDRKRKAREAVEARKAKARQAALDKAKGIGGDNDGVSPNGPATGQQSLLEKLEQVNEQRKKEGEEGEQRELEQKRLQEEADRKRQEEDQRRQQEILEIKIKEEEDALRREEEEMRALEEQLQREEEEAKRMAEEEEQVTRALLKKEEEKIRNRNEEEEKLMAEAERILLNAEKEEMQNAKLIEAHEKLETELKAEEEAKFKAEEEARLKTAAAERTRKAEEEGRQRAEQQAILKAEEEARILDEQRQAEEARLAIEWFAEEEQRKAEAARLAVEQFVESHTGGSAQDELIAPPSMEPDLDDLLDGSLSAVLDSALASPMQSPKELPKKTNNTSLYGSFTKLLPGGKKKGTTTQEKPKLKDKAVTITTTASNTTSGLRFYKPKTKAPEIAAKKTVPNSKPSASTSNAKTVSRPASVAPKLNPQGLKPKPTVKTESKKVANIVSNIEHVPKRAPKSSPKPSPKRSPQRSPNRSPPVKRAVDDLAINTVNKTPRNFPKSPARSVDSTGSVCSVDHIPRSPFRPATPDEVFPVCNHPFVTKLHGHRGGCQVCIFKLSQEEKDKFEKSGRHIRVNQTYSGCDDCQVFPSGEGEDPVRLCKQCFFDTHVVAPRRVEAFSGYNVLAGAVEKPRATPKGLKILSANRV